MSWRNYPLLLFVPPEMNCEPFLQLLYQFRVLFTTGLLAAVHKPSTWPNLTDRITGYTQTRGTAHYYYYYYYYSPSSIGTTARCGLWPVELYPSIFFYPSQPFSVFSLPALEDLFLLPLSILSWVFPFASSLPVLEWRSFWAPYPPPFSLGDLTILSFCLFIHFHIFSPLLISFSSRFVLLFHSPFSYLGPYMGTVHILY